MRPPTITVTLTHTEALAVAALLKLTARRSEQLADRLSDMAAINDIRQRAASFDDVADRLYRPIVGDDGISKMCEHADAITGS